MVKKTYCTSIPDTKVFTDCYRQVAAIYSDHYRQVPLYMLSKFHCIVTVCTYVCIYSILVVTHLIDPEDWRGATTYTVGFNLTVQSDRSEPLTPTESYPIYLGIEHDTLVEGDEVFTCRIISTSDAARVIIGPMNEVPVTIIDDDRELYARVNTYEHVHMYIRT